MADCGNLNQAKGKAYNTLREFEEEKTPDKD